MEVKTSYLFIIFCAITSDFLLHGTRSSNNPDFHTCRFMFQGFMSVLKMKFFRFSWNNVTRYFTAVLAAWLVLAASVHLNKGQFPFPSTIQNSSVWSTLEKVSPQFVSLLLVTLMYEIPLTAFGMVAQFVASSRKKRGKTGIICMCLWILLHILSWLRTWKKLEKYISLLDFSIAHVSF